MKKKTKCQTLEALPPQAAFTFDDHLQAQREIERRAHELWLLGGRKQLGSLQDWLWAEREITERIVRRRLNASSTASSAECRTRNAKGGSRRSRGYLSNLKKNNLRKASYE